MHLRSTGHPFLEALPPPNRKAGRALRAHTLASSSAAVTASFTAAQFGRRRSGALARTAARGMRPPPGCWLRCAMALSCMLTLGHDKPARSCSNARLPTSMRPPQQLLQILAASHAYKCSWGRRQECRGCSWMVGGRPLSHWSQVHRKCCWDSIAQLSTSGC